MDPDISRQQVAELKHLFQAAARGDVPAFEALYDCTAPWLLADVRRIAGDSRAEVLLTEIYLQVWHSLPTYRDSGGEPLVWLQEIVRRQHPQRAGRVGDKAAARPLDGPAGLMV